MADVVTPLLNAVTPSGTGTFYSNAFNTKDYRDFSFRLSMPSTGAGSGTLDIWIEESNDPDFADLRDIRVLRLEDPTGTGANQFTQVTGSTTLPGDSQTSTTLRQSWDFKGTNIARAIRVKYVVGTANNFSDIQLDLLVNNKV